MDYITVENLRIHAAHGHYEHERQVEQEFVVSLRVGVDAKQAGKSDELADTIDYDQIRDVVQRVFSGKGHYLIEYLAEEIAAGVLALSALEVTVCIQKTAVWPNGVPGIEITRRKS